MHAMVLDAPGRLVELRCMPRPQPGPDRRHGAIVRSSVSPEIMNCIVVSFRKVILKRVGLVVDSIGTDKL
jgi:hypothetical protein